MPIDSLTTGTPAELCTQVLADTGPDMMQGLGNDEVKEAADRIELILSVVMKSASAIAGEHMQGSTRGPMLGEIFEIAYVDDPAARRRFLSACDFMEADAEALAVLERIGNGRSRVRTLLELLNRISDEVGEDVLETQVTVTSEDHGAEEKV